MLFPENLHVERATSPAAEYFRAARELTGLLSFIFQTAQMVDWSLAQRQGLTAAEWAKSDSGPYMSFLGRAQQLVWDLLLGRVVDNFQTYLVSLIREVLRKRPEILSDFKPELDVKAILTHGSIDSLVSEVVERKVDKLAYRGFEDLAKWCQERRIPLVVQDGVVDRVIELIATRNLIAHKRGVVDQKYLSKVKASPLRVGNARRVTFNDFCDAVSVLNRIVYETDESAASKFELERVKLDIAVYEKP